jgi:hypothetical protein
MNSFLVCHKELHRFSPSQRGWLTVFSMLAIGFAWLAPPLHAQYVYVANEGGFNVSAYSIAAGGALIPVPASPFTAGEFPY